MAVKVTFVYEPDDPDATHPMGVTNEEYDRVTQQLMYGYGAEEVLFERVHTPTHRGEPKTKRKKA